jgi:prevent-host-death family protein
VRCFFANDGRLCIDIVLYNPYSIEIQPKLKEGLTMQEQLNTKSAEQARNQLPALIAAAAEGRTTIITKHGRPLAAVVPAAAAMAAMAQLPITAFAGTGKGLWGKNSTKAVAKLRDEWDR